MKRDELILSFRMLSEAHDDLKRIGVGINLRVFNERLADVLDHMSNALGHDETAPQERTIIQIAGSENCIYALCSDATLWTRNKSGGWSMHPDIPQPCKETD